MIKTNSTFEIQNDLARFSTKIRGEIYLKTIKQPQLIKNLKLYKIRGVIDVRDWYSFPFYFLPKNLGPLLKDLGIAYFRMHKLGNPKKLRDNARSPLEAKKWYIHYLRTNTEAQNEFKKLMTIIDDFNGRIALICYCPTLGVMECHRFWLKEELANQKRINLGLPAIINFNLKEIGNQVQAILEG